MHPLMAAGSVPLTDDCQSKRLMTPDGMLSVVISPPLTKE